MDAIKCSNCGAPVPIGISTHGFECPFCGSTESVDPDLQDRIRRFHELLKNFDESIRKIPDRLKGAIEKTLKQGRMAQFGIGTIAASFLFISIVMLSELVPRWIKSGTGPDLRFVFSQSIPLQLFFMILLYMLFLHWRSKALRLTYRARPPVVPNGPARCRLCGGDLPDTGVIRTCPYCGADSIIVETEFAEYEENLANEIEAADKDLEKKLRKQTRRIEKAFDYSGFAIMAMVGFAVVFNSSMSLLFSSLHVLKSSGMKDFLSTLMQGGIGIGIVFVIFFVIVLPKMHKAIKKQRGQWSGDRGQ
jgi:uncharacterized Zn finger protein (UPF0148 family)